MESVYRISAQLIEKTSTDIIRYLFDRIQWEDRLIGIKGARGVGKTTIMLQYIKLKIADRRKAL
ncbi:MAG: ATP-binding protein, partial [Bacteroidales bacterium]|nr:ATP-binding protein [Bacteroidales bacterium]